MSLGWWVVVVLFWLSPLLWVLIVGLRPVPVADEIAVPAPREERDSAMLDDLMDAKDDR